MDLRIFALKSRSSAIKANRAVGSCQEFYAEVRREFGARDDQREGEK